MIKEEIGASVKNSSRGIIIFTHLVRIHRESTVLWIKARSLKLQIRLKYTNGSKKTINIMIFISFHFSVMQGNIIKSTAVIF